MSMDLTGALTEKIGPLPGYAYAGIGVAAVFAYKKFRPTKAVVTPSSDAPTNLGISPSANPADVASNVTPDNSAWALAAAQHLATTTPLSGSEISTALANYLSGGGLSTAQQNIVNQAIAAQGFPSQGLIPVVAQDVPAPTLPSAQPTYQNMPYDTGGVTNNYYYPSNPTPAPAPAPVSPPSSVGGTIIPIPNFHTPAPTPSTTYVDTTGRPGDYVTVNPSPSKNLYV